MNYLISRIKHKVETPFKAEGIVGRTKEFYKIPWKNLFLSFLGFLARYIFETNLCLFIIFQRNLILSRIAQHLGL